MIKFSNLTKKYDAVVALDNISREINSGEITGILGPNGAGKTTLLKTITCYMYPTDGELTVDDLDIYSDSLEIRNLIGYLPEHAPLYTEMSVFDYLSFICDIRKIPKQQIKEKIKKVANTCGLNNHMFKTIDTLSKGYRQRVGLAQAIIHDPKILILDEPTTGLDPNQIVEIRKLIKELGKEKTVIFSTHILQEVQALCDRVIILNKGNIVADGTAESITEAVQGNEHLRVILKGEQNIESFRIIPEITKLESATDNGNTNLLITYEGKKDIRESVFNFCKENNFILLEMFKEKISLENVFAHLTLEKEKVEE